MKTSKFELISQLLPLVNELKREQRKAGEVVAVMDVTREQLQKFSLSELKQLKREIENLQKVKEVQKKNEAYNELNANSEEKKAPFKIMC